MSTDPVDALIRDLVQSLAGGERDYAELMEAWRTSCPRLPVWEEAVARGLIERVRADDGAKVAITAGGRAFLASAARAR